MINIDYKKMTPTYAITGEDNDETEQLKGLHIRAKDYLQSFPWCGGIKSSYLGIGVGDIVGVFLFEFEPVGDGVDNILWVVVGDIPPAYLVLDQAGDANEALKIYIEEMRVWVKLVFNKKGVHDVIPVNVTPTIEHANALKSRLDFLEREIYKG